MLISMRVLMKSVIAFRPAGAEIKNNNVGIATKEGTWIFGTRGTIHSTLSIVCYEEIIETDFLFLNTTNKHEITYCEIVEQSEASVILLYNLVKATKTDKT